MKNISVYFKQVIEGILAGLLISIGGAVFLSCLSDTAAYGRYIGAFFFSTALLCICIKGYSLYTGKIGYVLEKHSKEDLSVLLLGLLGNAIGTICAGYLLALTLPSLKETALSLCEGKLAQGYGFALVRACFCGVLVYLAVDIFKADRSVLGIVFCIPVFILSGYEHSIADIFYFAVSGIVSVQALGYLFLIILGNSLGALLIPALKLVGKKKESEKNRQDGEFKRNPNSPDPSEEHPAA